MIRLTTRPSHRLRVATAVLGMMVGLVLAITVMDDGLGASVRLTLAQDLGIVLMGVAGCGLVGYGVTPVLARAARAFTGSVEGYARRIGGQDFLLGALGALVGLGAGDLMSSPLSQIPVVGHILPTITSVTLGYVGVVLAVRKRDDIWTLLARARPPREAGAMAPSAPPRSRPKILDTSVIIDGRILDVCRTGFIEGELVVPGFVLEELRHIADSADVLKRNRGRRGLDILNRIQKELSMPVTVYERDVGPGLEVDSKLLRLAMLLGGQVLTNDYNLNKVAELQGVAVLNLNELANAVKPVVLPGEDMTVHVIKDGKETGQGVAYLDDGTMIVVDGGKKYIGETVGVLVTSVLQTAAGRMIFAKPKLGEGKVHAQP